MSDIYKAPEAELNDPSQPGEYGSLEKALSGNYELQPIETLKRAWSMLKGMKTTYWLAIIVYVVIAIAVTAAAALITGQSITEPSTTYGFGNFVGDLVTTLVLGPIAAGLYMIPIKYSVGAKIEVGELFKHFDKTIPLFLMTLLMYLTIIIGFILLIIPGIYLAVSYAFAIPLMIDKNMGPWEALNTSRKAITHKWFNMFGFIIIGMLAFMAGAIALLVGLIWVIPLLGLATGLLYRDIFGVEQSTMNA